MDFDQYIPSDPNLMRRLDKAFKRALADYDHNIEAMEQYGDQVADIPEGQRARLQLVDANDREVQYYDPVMMRDYRDYMLQYWQQMRAHIKEAKTAQEQMGAVFSVVKESFAVAAYTGAHPLMPQCFDEIVNQVAVSYEDKQSWQQQRAENEAADNVERLGPSQRAYIQQALTDLCQYSHMCLEALADIEFLAQHYDATHGMPTEEIGATPYDIMVRRYCGARGITDMANAQLPEEDRNRFFEDETKFFKEELYGDFRDLFPKDRACPEMAWFIAAAIDAVRIEEVEGMLEEDQPKPRAIPPSQRIRLHRANDNGDQPSFVEMISAPRAEMHRQVRPKFDNDAGRSDEEIMNDPTARLRMREILQDLLDSYPNMATKFSDMLAAKEYMQHMYLGVDEPEPTAGIVR